MEFDVTSYLSNLSYIDKDFPSLWQEILETVPKMTSKWNPSESVESDPLVVLLKILAIVTDKLNYNIDKNVLELLPDTLTQTRSAYSVYESLGYTPDWYKSATTTLTLNYNGMVGSSVMSVDSFTYNPTFKVPRFTSFSDDDSYLVYTSMEDAVFDMCTVEKKTVNAMEGTLEDLVVNGSSQILYSYLDSNHRLYFPEQKSNIAQNGIFISNEKDFSDITYETISSSIEGDGVTTSTVATSTDDYTTTVWTRVDNLNRYMSGSKVFKLGIDPTNNTVYLEFPEDIGDLIEEGIYIKYIVSSGEQGNVGSNNISKFLSSFELSVESDSGESYTITEDNITVTNSKSTSNGSDPLTVEEMRRQFKKTVGIFNTLVTLRDYENYIYRYEGSAGDNVVSNIRVTDRYNDLWDSLTYKYLGSSNQIFSTTITLPQGKPNMDAFALKLYPLQPSSSLETKALFNKTFNLQEDNKTFIDKDGDLANLTIEVENVLSTSKCVSHDFLESEYPILLPYDLNGQIYLKSTVSSIDAVDILSNVELAIYKNFNSRELEWGKAINYNDLFNVIIKADHRIQTLGLAAIQYDTPILYKDIDDHGFDLIERTILNGSMPWTTMAPYLFDYDMTFDSETVATGFYVNVTSLMTYVDISNKDEADTYIVNTNETFTILTPKYQTITSYSNYLYVIAYSSDESISLTANRPYTLSNSCTLYIYESRTDAENDIDEYLSSSVPFSRANYYIDEGTIIRATIDIEFSHYLTKDSLINLGSSGSIEVIEKAQGTLKASNVITGASDTSKLYIATNSQSLVSALTRDNTEYTLLSGEYFFYTDETGSELGIIGEGTTLSVDQRLSTISFIGVDSSIKSLTEGDLKSVSYTEWSRANSGAIKYILNDLNTFGAEYVIKIESDDGNPFSNYEENVFWDAPKGCTIKYQLADIEEDEYGVTSYNIDPRGWTTFSSISNEDVYKILIRLKLVTGPGVEQALLLIYEDTEVVFKEDLVIAYTTQRLEVETLDFSTPIEISSTGEEEVRLQTSSLVSSEGGISLDFDSEDNVQLMSYVGSILTSNYNSYDFLQLKHIDIATQEYDQDIYSLTTPGKWPEDESSFYTEDHDCVIVPYIKDDEVNTVYYELVRAQYTLDFKDTHPNWLYVGRPSLVDREGTYYSKEPVYDPLKIEYTNYPKVYWILREDDNSEVELDENYIYISTFCPMITPSDSDLIKDPTLPSSYFRKQHPYNKFSLPFLRSLEGLTINPTSIKTS